MDDTTVQGCIKREIRNSESEGDAHKKFREGQNTTDAAEAVLSEPDVGIAANVSNETAEQSCVKREIMNSESEEDAHKKFKKDEDTTDPAEALLSEPDVGITEYVSDHKGFSGVIKQRYSDFLVSEISLDGTLVKLDDLKSLPPDEETPELPAPAVVFSQETLDELQELVDQVRNVPVVIEVESKSKVERRHIHQTVKKVFPQLSSDTETRADKKVLVIQLKNKRQMEDDKYRRQQWPSTRGNYTHFVLFKENFDTHMALSMIAKKLRMKPASFSYAGVKDKRAKTVQAVTVHRVEGSRLLEINKCLRNIAIGNVTYRKEPLRLGDLIGNRFRIVLRNALGSKEEITKAIDLLAEKGFINYFGMQRFGSTTVSTHSIGLALLKSDWQKAVHLIMKPRKGEDQYSAMFRKLWAETGDPQKVLNFMKRQLCVESQLMLGIQIHGKKNLVSALTQIPRNSRLIYVHGYQSWLWNRILSKRIQEYGLEAIEGDLILKSDVENLSIENQKVAKRMTSMAVPTILKSGESASIYDVVLPLFGYDVQYPKNKIADWYREMLKENGLDIDEIKHRVKDYSLSGTYRHILVKPTEVQWSLVNYADAKIAMFQSDYEVTQQIVLPEPVDGPFQAVKIEFNLPSSCYATMALREILRADTSPNFQSTLNVA